MEEDTQKIKVSSLAKTVLKWYVAYCVLMALLYFVTMGGGVAILFLGLEDFVQDAGSDALGMKIQGAVYFVLGIVLFVPYVVAPFLPNKPWVWVYGIVMIAIGMTSCCCLPITIPLLVYWLKPEVKAYFGKSVETLPAPPAASPPTVL